MKKIFFIATASLCGYLQINAQSNPQVRELQNILRAVRSNGTISTLGELDIIPAKSMTLEEAYENIALYHQLGVISISPLPQFDNAGNVILPRQIPQITLNKIGSSANYIQFNYQGSDYGVSIWYNPASTPPPRTDIVQLVHNRLDARNVVGFMRMVMWLAVEKNVVQFHHTGMRGSESRADCHGEGRAVDFVGVVFDDGGTLFVGKNWASKKVLKLPGFEEQATSSQWPPKSQTLHFRLDIDEADQEARTFFSDLYSFIQSQYQDKTTGRNDPGETTIGSMSYIIHPDHYMSNQDGNNTGRQKHEDHIHMQIGVTGKSN